MLASRYLTSVKNLQAILNQLVEGTAPEKYSVEHLKRIGFKSSNDRAIIPLLKELGFLTPEGSPTARYHAYRNRARSRQVLGEALRDAYGDVFHLNERPSKDDRKAIEGLFKTTHNVSDRVAQLQAMTFVALLGLADVDVPPKADDRQISEAHEEEPLPSPVTKQLGLPAGTLSLRHNIEIHLPATKDIEVFNAIFKALKEHLID